MRLCALLPGSADVTAPVLQRLGLWGTGIGLDPAWSLAEARAAITPFQARGLAVVQGSCYRNLVAPDERVRQQAITDLQRALALAEAVGIPAVVSGAGHRDPTQPEAVFAVHLDNWTTRTFDLLVETCQAIVQDLIGKQVVFCVEPWVVTPLSTPARLETLVRRVDHPNFGILLDPVNLMTPDYYPQTGRLIAECFDRLGPAIRLVHAKDTLLKPRPFTYHMAEAIPGEGVLDYPTLLTRLQDLAPETPLILEHLPDAAALERAYRYLCTCAARVGVPIR